MENLMQRVEKALRREFSVKELILQDAGKGMVGGWIFSKSFDKLTEIERQQKVWSLFDRYLNERERRRIVGFLTFTPLEKKMIFEDDLDNFKLLSKKNSSKKKRTTTASRARKSVKRRNG